MFTPKKIMTQYLWRVKTRLPERFMTPCKVLVRGKLNTCLVEFEDGYRVTTSRNYVIKRETLQKDSKDDLPKAWRNRSNLDLFFLASFGCKSPSTGSGQALGHTLSDS